MVGMRSEYGRNMVGMRLEYGRNMVGMRSEYGWNMVENDLKINIFFNSDSTRNDSEKLGMAKNLSLNFILFYFIFFTRNEVGIWSDPLGFLPFRSDPLGMCGEG